MKLYEITAKKQHIKPSNVDKKGSQIKLPSFYDNVDYGYDDTAQQTVTVKDTNTGAVWGRRTLAGKKVKSGKGLREQFVAEGGNVFKDQTGTPVTQRINKQDVDPTLKFLERITDLPLVDNKLGTTGGKDTSGDIDVAVDSSKVSKDQLVNVLGEWVQQHANGDPKNWIKKTGSSVHFKTPIKGSPSNGFVQTDFMFGDPQWMKFTYQGSDVADSPFKGAHRHILMSSIAKANGLKWSPTQGLVSRESGNIVSQDPNEIAQILLGQGADQSDLRSVESILQKIKDLPEYEQLIADAREAFEKEGLHIPSQTNESFIQFLCK